MSLSILVSLEYTPRSGIAGSYGGFISNFLRHLHIIFHSGCINLHSHQQGKSISFSQHCLQHLLFVDFYDNHSHRWEMISHCGFDLHFSNNWWCWASSYVPVSCLYVFFGKLSIQFSAHFSIGLFVFWWRIIWAVYIFWIITPYRSPHL